MPEVLETAQQQSTNAAAAQTENAASPSNIFDVDSWAESSSQPAQQPVAETIKEAPEVKKEEENTIDADEYIKTHFQGYENLDSVKSEFESLKKFREEHKPSEFTNEDSKRWYELIKGGKEEDLYFVLEQKRKLQAAQNLDVTKPEDAAQLIKLSMQYKYKEQQLTSDEIEHLFKKEFPLPAKPERDSDELDEEYDLRIARWKEQVAEVEKGMIISAKLTKPELAKYQSEIVLPDIPKVEQPEREPTPEELKLAQQQKDSFLMDVDKQLSSFAGYTAKYKDEEVELPISYEVSPEEKTNVKSIIESLYVDNSYLLKRWENPDRTPNIGAMMRDIHLLENSEKILQKMANEAGSQRWAAHLKSQKNIQVTGATQQPFVPDAEKSYNQKQAEAIWDA